MKNPLAYLITAPVIVTLAVVVFVGTFTTLLQIQQSVRKQEAEWAEACSVVASINDKNTVNTANTRFAKVQMDAGEDIRWISLAYSGFFQRIERGSNGHIQFYVLSTAPSPGEAVACVTDGKRIFPPLQPEWQLCRTFPELKN